MSDGNMVSEKVFKFVKVSGKNLCGGVTGMEEVGVGFLCCNAERAVWIIMRENW